jgi:hypothetical protein
VGGPQPVPHQPVRSARLCWPRCRAFTWRNRYQSCSR